MWSSTIFFLRRGSETTATVLSLSVVSTIGWWSVHIGLVEQASGWIVGFAISVLIILALTRIGSMSSLAAYYQRHPDPGIYSLRACKGDQTSKEEAAKAI